MTPTEMKAAAFDTIARIVKGTKGDHCCLAAVSRVDDVIAKLELDERRFWKRMAKFDRDIVSGKNRNFQMVREWTNFNMGDGEILGPKRLIEYWNPDTKQWEREKPSLPVPPCGGN